MLLTPNLEPWGLVLREMSVLCKTRHLGRDTKSVESRPEHKALALADPFQHDTGGVTHSGRAWANLCTQRVWENRAAQ